MNDIIKIFNVLSRILFRVILFFKRAHLQVHTNIYYWLCTCNTTTEVSWFYILDRKKTYSPVSTQSKIFPSDSSSPLFQWVGCEQGGWDQALEQPWEQHGRVQKLHLRCSQLGWCVFLCVCRWVVTLKLLFAAFFIAVRSIRVLRDKQHPSHLYRLVTLSGWVLFISAWRQTHTVSGRCNLALQSSFMQKQNSLGFYWLQYYEMSEKEHELTKQMKIPCGQCTQIEHYRCFPLARWCMVSCTIM